MVSVLPVPAGPDKELLSYSLNVLIKLIKHFSVKGVITNCCYKH